MANKKVRKYPSPVPTKILQFKSVKSLIYLRLEGGNQILLEKRLVLLISNHFENTRSIIELFKYHLFLSEKSVSTKVANVLRTDVSKSADSNLIEFFGEQSLNAAIIFANSSFDYLQILVALFFVPINELTSIVTVREIQEKMRKTKLDSSDWYLAFFSLIQTYFQKSRDSKNGWYKLYKDIIPPPVRSKYEELEKLTSSLRKNYQANSLKHYGITAFSKSDPSNILRRSYASFDITDFFSNNLEQIKIGSRGNELKLDSTHTFLFNYLEKIVDFHDELCNLLEEENRSTDGNNSNNIANV